MGTSFNQIYKRFLSKVEDPTFAEMADEDVLEILRGLLMTAIGSVREFKDGGYTLTEDNSSFLYTLSNSEKEVIALGMLEAWEEGQANSVTLTKHFISSKEELFFAQHNHLNGILGLKTATFHEKERIRSRYKTLHNSYLETDEELNEGDDIEDELMEESYADDDPPVGGTSDYNKLRNKPSINNVTLQGNVELTGLMNENSTVDNPSIDIIVSSAFEE